VKRGKYVSPETLDISPVGRMLQKSCGSTQRHGQLFVLEKMLQNQFPGAFEAQLYRRNGRIPDPPGIVDVNVTQSETEVWHNLKAVISAEGAKFNTSPGRTYVQKINDLVQSQVHNRKNVDRSRSTTKSCLHRREQGYYHYGYVRNRRPEGAFKNSVAWEDGEELHFEERYAAGLLYDRPQSSRF
jgi:hypothetical protein